MALGFDVRIVGVALETEGFLGYQFTRTPLGLMTQGFLNDCADIWTDSDIPITTVWDCNLPNPNPDVEFCAGD